MIIEGKEMNKNMSMVDLALRYLKTDKLSVIPVGKNKIPFISWKPYQTKLPTMKQVREWWKQYPDAQIGIVTGKLSNMTVIDVEAGGDWSYLPETLTVKTGGGGRHFIYQYCEKVTNKTRLRELTDVRSEGGYIVAPGSTSDKGEYETLKLMPPAPFPLHLFPNIFDKGPSFLNKIKKEPLPIKKKEEPPENVKPQEYAPVTGPIDIFKIAQPITLDQELIDLYPGFEPGQRNQAMAQFIGLVLSKVHPSEWETRAKAIVWDANDKNDPALSDYELNSVFRSISNREAKQISDGVSTPAEQAPLFSSQPIQLISTGDDDVKHIAEVAREQKVDQTDIYPLEMPCFDEAILGGVCPGDLIIIAGKTGEGKCESPGTEIIMFDGSIKKIEDIKVGEMLLGPDSSPRKVLNITSGFGRMYKIDQMKGDSYTVNSNHILSLKRTQNCLLKRGKPAILHKGEILNIPVEEYMNKSKWFKHMYKGWQSEAIDWKRNKEVEIDPYFLGVWLGDGTSDAPHVTSMDEEIIKFLEGYSKTLGMSFTKSEKISKNGIVSNASTYKITHGKLAMGSRNILLEKLRKENLINNKHIPRDYKINSRDIRLQLLAGMIDTDGYVNHNGYVIINKNKTLIEDFAFIARSLGFRCLIRKIVKEIKSIGFVGEYWKLSISGDCSEIPVKIERKKVNPRKQKKDVLLNGIKVTSIGAGKYYGFELDKDGLYLHKDFTVTHNSSCAMDWTMSMIRGKRNASVLWFSYELLPTHLWAKFQKMGMTEKDIAVIPAKHSSGNVAWVEAKVKEAKEKFHVKVIVIDHLGFLLPKIQNVFGRNMSSNYATFLTQITREIKRVAINEEVIIILPVHMKKTDKVDMDAIKDSAGISQESDLVFLIERERDKKKSAKAYYTDYTKITLSKNRKTGQTVVGWFKMFQERFVYDLEKNNLEEQNAKDRDAVDEAFENIDKPGPVASSPVNKFGRPPVPYEDSTDKKEEKIISEEDRILKEALESLKEKKDGEQ